MLRHINRPLFAGVTHRDLVTVHRFLRGIIEHGYDAIRVAQGFKPSGASPGTRRRRA
jgi:hypothetical protein